MAFVWRWAGLVPALCLSCAMVVRAQSDVTPPANVPSGHEPSSPPLSPGEIYKQAMHPLDVVRSSMDNWSDAEVAAFVTGMHIAKAACDQATPENYTGDDLYDLARLCSLGQDWNAANTAASRYLDSRADPHRTQAYAISITALMHLQATESAVVTASTMMENQPYDAETAYAVLYLKDALEHEDNPQLLSLAEEEHPRIVKALEAGTALKAVHGPAVISLGALYESAMQLSFWQRYRHQDAQAAATVKDIETALSKTTALSGEDRPRIDAIRKQYALLGEPLPAFKTTPLLEPPKSRTKPVARQPAHHIGPDFGAATILVLFPDWCPQCRRMMKPLTEFATANKDTPVHAFGLMFLDDPALPEQTPEASQEANQAAHAQNLKELQGTSTLLVDSDTAQLLGAIDFPLGIVLDQDGRVRYVGVLPGDAFAGNGYMEKVLLRMAGATTQAPVPGRH